jgi:alkylated DNA repair dioxygenase AlkB
MNSGPALPSATIQPGLFDGEEISTDPRFAASYRIQLDETSWIDHVPGWLSGHAQLLDLLISGIDWEQRERWMFTRLVTEPRLTAEYADIRDTTQPILPAIAASLSQRYNVPYERLWMNLYRDHNDGTGWHADRPANQADEAIVPVLSVGATRRFLIRAKAGGRSRVITAAGGDLVVMGGRCQRDWQHCVPKQKTPAGPRSSLNFSRRQYG